MEHGTEELKLPVDPSTSHSAALFARILDTFHRHHELLLKEPRVQLQAAQKVFRNKSDRWMPAVRSMSNSQNADTADDKAAANTGYWLTL